ncbi:hypothetical protein CDCA_CDCA11G3309 [Cyanidium caldarium]|uniref:Uncharacterized protein n=1 Tax=Cyanidium caldarium TaxID=2771 RepID=A0AAV9IYE8_CYACA|nr:hypothetical protein CDCA_CDCA11G3309 [Cyanidium caldarium]
MDGDEDTAVDSAAVKGAASEAQPPPNRDESTAQQRRTQPQRVPRHESLAAEVAIARSYEAYATSFGPYTDAELRSGGVGGRGDRQESGAVPVDATEGTSPASSVSSSASSAFSLLLQRLQRQPSPASSSEPERGLPSAAVDAGGREVASASEQSAASAVVELGSAVAVPSRSDRPRLVFMGMARSGKTSLQSVVFHRVAPHETLFLESTHRVIRQDMGHSVWMQFQVVDTPACGSDFWRRTTATAAGAPSKSGTAGRRTSTRPPLPSTRGGDGAPRRHRSSPLSLAPRLPRDAQRSPPDVQSGSRDGSVAHDAVATATSCYDAVLADCDALLFVIDATAPDWLEALRCLCQLTEVLARHYDAPSSETIGHGSIGRRREPVIQVLLHKSDTLSDDERFARERELWDALEEMLRAACLWEFAAHRQPFYLPFEGDATPPSPERRLGLSLTSTFDNSCYEALARTVQRLTPELLLLEQLLNGMVASCGMEKVFLFDKVTKLYLATDASSVHPADLELCADAFVAVDDLRAAYRPQRATEVLPSSEPKEERVDQVVDVADSRAAAGAASPETSSSAVGAASARLTADRLHYALVRLDNHMLLYVVDVGIYLTLVGIFQAANFERRSTLIDYNLRLLQAAMEQLADASRPGMLRPETERER